MKLFKTLFVLLACGLALGMAQAQEATLVRGAGDCAPSASDIDAVLTH